MKSATLRFYEELNDFLPPAKRKVPFQYRFYGSPSVKDVIESCGAPHTEVDLIIVNGNSVGFDYRIKEGDYISVYPEFESIDITPVQKLRPSPLRNPRFILDVHLGRLARYLRICGFDSLYRNDFSDEEIIDISVNEKRCILTRDVGILKNNKVVRGYWIRNQSPVKQLREVVGRFDLAGAVQPFSLCIECNVKLNKTEKEKVENLLPPKVKKINTEFYRCPNCKKVYWKGTHYKKMIELIRTIQHEGR
ncbi:Mut7-C RNAse domain-containing protein [Melioribacter sp. Ez-97]|uniref:Mut7-C RNAse domain-containing protein n=1 Tax=Melioribacter sp. Ez-97 TaxID=3423434 RepID=UPI003EDA5AFA